MSQQKGMSFKEFREQFQTEEACEAYLFQRRWPEGFVCPKCGGTGCYQLRGRREYVCKHCHRQSSVTVGTALQKKLCKSSVKADKVSSRKQEQIKGLPGQGTAQLNWAYPPVFWDEGRYARAA